MSSGCDLYKCFFSDVAFPSYFPLLSLVSAFWVYFIEDLMPVDYAFFLQIRWDRKAKGGWSIIGGMPFQAVIRLWQCTFTWRVGLCHGEDTRHMLQWSLFTLRCQSHKESFWEPDGIPESKSHKSVLAFNSFSLQVCVCSVAQSCPTVCDPTDCSLSSSSVHGILQARVLEWVVILFSSFSLHTSPLVHIASRNSSNLPVTCFTILWFQQFLLQISTGVIQSLSCAWLFVTHGL